MLNVTQDYVTSTLSPSRCFKIRVVIKNTTYTEDDIVTFSYNSSINDGEKFIIGGGYVNTISIEFLRILENVQEHTPIDIYVSLKVNNQFIELPLGHFFVTEALIDRNANKTTLNASDFMLFTEKAYTSELEYPTTVRKIFEEITMQLKIGVANNVIVNDDVVTTKLNNVTYRQALIYIAQLNGAFARVDRYGNLDISRLNSTTRRISKDNYMLNGLTKNEIDFRLTGIVNSIGSNDNKVVIQSGNSNGVQMELANPWMTQTILDRVFHEYRKLNYFPYNLTWQGDISLESVDWISVEHADVQWINVPMLNYSLTFNGGIKATSSAKASAQKQGQYAYKGIVSKKIEYMEGMMSGLKPMYLDTVEPNDPKIGALWFKPNGAAVELYEYHNNNWVKKADTADVSEIVNTFTTDEILAKKMYAAIANFIEINANKIVAGDIDLQRLRIMDGTKEVLAVRDNKLIVNFGDDLNIDGINGQLQHTLSQIDALRQQQKELQLDLIAKAAVEDLKRWQEDYENLVINYQADKSAAEQALIASSQRVDAIQNNLGALGASLNFLTTYMRANEDGFFIGNKTSNTSFRVTNDRISLFSGGNEVMYITEGLIHIDNGIFTTTLQIGGYYRFEEYSPQSNDHNLILRYLGTQGGRLNG